MTLEEVIKKSRIVLPKNINTYEAEKIIKYLAKKLPAEINYEISCSKFLNYDKDFRFNTKTSSTKINGRIDYLNSIPLGSDNFEFEKSQKDMLKFKTIQFQIVPGWELSDYRPEIKQLWDKTREVVNNYFLKKN